MGEDEDERKWRMVEVEGVAEEEEDSGDGVREIKDWEMKTIQERRTQELRGSGRRGVLRSPARKRMVDQEDGGEHQASSPDISTRRKKWLQKWSNYTYDCCFKTETRFSSSEKRPCAIYCCRASSI